MLGLKPGNKFEWEVCLAISIYCSLEVIFIRHSLDRYHHPRSFVLTSVRLFCPAAVLIIWQLCCDSYFPFFINHALSEVSRISLDLIPTRQP